VLAVPGYGLLAQQAGGELRQGPCVDKLQSAVCYPQCRFFQPQPTHRVLIALGIKPPISYIRV